MKKLDDIKIKNLKTVNNNKGNIFPIHKKDELMKGFGEAYFSFIHPGVIKAWHLHNKMTTLYSLVEGDVMCVITKKKSNNKKRLFKKIRINIQSRKIVKVPPYFWVGFKAIGSKTAIVLNITSLPYLDDKPIRLDINNKSIEFDWENL